MDSETQLFSTLQGATAAHTAATARNTGVNPFSFRKVHRVIYLTQQMGPTALRPIRRTKQLLSVLLKDTRSGVVASCDNIINNSSPVLFIQIRFDGHYLVE